MGLKYPQGGAGSWVAFALVILTFEHASFVQDEEPDSDRRCIKGIPILEKLTRFEDSIGVKFDHIRLLAKAFTWRNVHENILTQ